MNVYYSNDFTGIWPVGTAAIVVAESEEEARKLLDRKLGDIGLVFDGTLVLVDDTVAEAIVLRDGNY